MKKLVSFLLVICLVMSVLPSLALTASAETSGTTGDCTWTLDGNGVLTISGNGAMGNNVRFGDEITEVVIEEGVTSIGNYAFYYCQNLKKITIPDSVISIDYYSFKNPFSKVKVKCNQDSYAREYAQSEFMDFYIPFGTTGDCTFTMDDNGILTISGNGKMGDYGLADDAPWEGSAINEIIINEGVTSIGNYAFSDCQRISSVSIPNTVKTIGDGAFFFNESLKSISIPEGVISLGDGVFDACYALRYIEMPSSVTHIGSEFIKDWSKESCGNNAAIYCYPDTYAYQYAIDNNIRYRFIGEVPTWSLDGTVLTISGVGPMDDYGFLVDGMIDKDKDGAPWHDKREIITDVIIEEGITTIGGFAFDGLSNLVNVTIPNTVEEIRIGAFEGCSALEILTIPESVTSIHYGSFEGCGSLKMLTIPENVKSIDYFAFEGCENLTIYCYHDTDAEHYAIDKEIPYVLLEKPHTHIWDDGEITVKPAEGHDGVRTYTCSECGETKTEAIEYIRGDMTGDGALNSADAVYLLRSIMRPAKYPLSQSANVDGDESMNSADAVYLLRHIMRPDKYPLN